MPRTRPPYPPEFRQEAVRLLRSGARSVKQLAGVLGCSPQTLSNSSLGMLSPIETAHSSAVPTE